jgi:FdhE protein
MPRAPTRIRTSPTAQVAEARPEWQAWIQLLELAWGAVEEQDWEPLRDTEPGSMPPAPSPNAPLLHGQTLSIDADRASHLLGDLRSRAAGGDLPGGRSLHGYRPSQPETLELIHAAVQQHHGTIAQIAAGHGIDPGALIPLANLAALPLLQSCGRLLQSKVAAAWSSGYCPICAAWPILAERRGLDRSRRLRCGRCAADWEVPWLYCIYCDEREHTRLGTLVESESRETLKVETCDSCGGYLKSLATLQRFPPLDLLLRDLETVELDLVALDRGYIRPEGRPFELKLSVIDHASR